MGSPLGSTYGSAQEARRRLPEVVPREEALATLLAGSKEIGSDLGKRDKNRILT